MFPWISLRPVPWPLTLCQQKQERGRQPSRRHTSPCQLHVHVVKGGLDLGQGCQGVSERQPVFEWGVTVEWECQNILCKAQTQRRMQTAGKVVHRPRRLSSCKTVTCERACACMHACGRAWAVHGHGRARGATWQAGVLRCMPLIQNMGLLSALRLPDIPTSQTGTTGTALVRSPGSSAQLMRIAAWTCRW